jgi:hypothetical protein
MRSVIRWSELAAPSTRIVPWSGASDVEDHPDRGRLAGAVRPEQTVDGPLRYRQRQVFTAHVLRRTA